ncbi:MAG: DUF4386 domain-containing protein [Chloroflexi bacterium]|nr:DUF4386 domain-containing protein [Chloroflexota bacterium]
MTVNENLQPTAKSTFTGNVSGAYESVSKMKSVQATARIAAVLYLVIAVLSGVAHGYVPSQLIVPGDAATTASNVMASEALLHMGGVGSELAILLSEIVLSVLLYILLKPVNRTLALLAAVFRLAMTTIHGINLLNYFFALQLLSGAGYLAVFRADQLQALALLFLNAHHYGFEIGIAFLTLHVFILGYLIFKSGYFPRILGILFTIAAVGYLIDSFGMLLLPNYTTTPAFIALPIVIAEIAFPLWLLIKGVNAAQWEKRALASA